MLTPNEAGILGLRDSGRRFSLHKESSAHRILAFFTGSGFRAELVVIDSVYYGIFISEDYFEAVHLFNLLAKVREYETSIAALQNKGIKPFNPARI